MPRKKLAPTQFKGALRNIDLDALQCLDVGHQWRLVEGRTNTGRLMGCPERVKMCMACGGLKVETTTWRGEVIARRYESDSTYLAESRKLDPDDVNNRRRVLRRLILEREFGRPAHDDEWLEPHDE